MEARQPETERLKAKQPERQETACRGNDRKSSCLYVGIRMKNKEKKNPEENRQKERGGNLLENVLATGVCIGAGALLGAASHYYKAALMPLKYDVRRDSDPSEKDYVEGRRWMKEHPLREDVYLRADDGLQLHANFIPAAPAEGDSHTEHRYAVCVHGYRDISESMGLYGRVYRDRYGMHVLFPDLRGHGKSDGTVVGMGYEDSADLLRWIDWILERDSSAQIVLHGISMGAAAVLLTTGRALPEQVAAAVSDSSYTSALEVFACRYKEMEGAVFPAPVMLEAVRAVALVRAGYDLAKASPVRAVARSKTPTLFIHGQADQIVPPSMMPALYKAAACRKAFLWIPEADHVQSVVCDPEAYWARIERFLHAQGVSFV